MIYRIRYVLRLMMVGGMGLLEAIRYPAPDELVRGDPVEDADVEMSYWEM